MFWKKKKVDNEKINLSEKQQIKLINIIYDDCSINLNKILDEFEKWKWDEYIKQDDPQKFFYLLILLLLYIYDAMLKKTYNKEVCYNVMITLLEQYAKKLEKDTDSFYEKALDDIADMDNFINDSISKGADVYSSMFLYLISEGCDVPYEIYSNPKEVLPLFVQKIFMDMADNFPKLIEKLEN